MTLRQTLECRGVKLTAKLTFECAEPLDVETLTLLKAHKDDLLRDLAAPDTLPCLPWQLKRLLSAAGSNVLTAELPGVRDVGRYTLAWGCAYLTGDRAEAERRLWQVYQAWQGVNCSKPLESR